ncbi:FG-GAP and VCBS repeat-containing protein [Streptomyces sp. NBC_00287]|uniref:FG-GAP and VCBS repeat-containing protein n=1 Tax=Streptomyces sp. NBC_00287 TaxID=2975702 RepID=UPI002E2E0494|nr:FG-GAP and VCBS repeat-containing protein [Streptomyces sp. NBC_00287]
MRKRTLRMTVATAVAMAASAALAPVAQADPAAVAATGLAKADFNGDGVADTATAAPHATVSGHKGAGYIAVTYGSRTLALKEQSRKVHHQNSSGVPGSAEADDQFGSAMTAADLDGDGYTDLVVGSRGEDSGTLYGSGTLTVLWGGKGGLTGGTVVKGADGESLGQALTAGDFDGDGHPDLATGTRVAHGPFGRTTGPARTETMDVRVDGAEEELWNAPTLATGDVNGDGISDVVAVVSHGEGELPYHGPRLAEYFAGSRDGLTAARILKDPKTGQPLDGGADVAVGDLDRDGYADIVLGRSGEEDMDGTEEVTRLGGAVEIVRGTASGPDTTSPRTLFHQDSAGVPGTAEYGDDFGRAVSLGDVNGDGRLDLAIGARGEGLGTLAGAGSVTVLLGGGTGLTTTGAKSLTQDTASVPGTAERADAFGAAVHLADTTGDGRAELFAGAPGENSWAGAVWALKGTATQVTGTGSASFGPSALGMTSSQGGLGTAFDR